jgi:diguanylate cyclase (GGDEF)-like protein/PAS domain S-box-containing protein
VTIASVGRTLGACLDRRIRHVQKDLANDVEQAHELLVCPGRKRRGATVASMSTLPRPAHLFTLSAAIFLSGLVLSWMGWPEAVRGIEFAVLMLAAVASSLPVVQPSPRDWPALRLAFLIEYTSLAIFGPNPAMVVAVCGVLTRELCEPARRPVPWQRLRNAATVLIGVQAAGAAYLATGGVFGVFSWPWQALPVAAGVLAYGVVASASPLIAFGPAALKAWRRWPRLFAQGCPTHIVGVSVAAALAELVTREAWAILVVAAAPLGLAWRVYADHTHRLERERRRSEAMDLLQEGVCAIDRAGIVTAWNDALERLLECPRDAAIGHSLTAAVPALAHTVVPRALEEVAKHRTPRILPNVSVGSPPALRVFRLELVPVTDGTTLLWHDVTDQTRVVQALQRHGERLELAAEVSNDGLWEWDLGTQQLYVTPRWKTMVGLPSEAIVSKPDDWFDRVHKDDLAALKQALEEHFSGQTHPFQHEHRLRLENGTYRFFQCRGVASRLHSGRPTRIAGSLTDTTDLAITQERLRNAVYLDPLTGLCNRAVFIEGLGRRLRESKRRRDSDPFAVLYLDLDRFKLVNDSLGHQVGDDLLVAVSRRLESCLRQGDVLARLGGDEFAILLNALQSEQQANVIAFRVQDALAKAFSIGGRELFTSASIGIAFGEARYTSPDEMMHDADTAMYHAKAEGKARHEVFDADMDARARDRLGLENDLRHAVDNNDFETHYQPIVSLASGMCVGFESLVRWNRNGKPVSPATFIPIAEELGLIERLGTRVLEEACRTFANWQRAYPDAGLDCITVNVSSRQLMQQNFLSVVDRAVRQAGLPPRALRVEITETALMTNPDEAAKVLSQLRDYGVKIYLDDFGTGYSSLSHLHKLPVDALKIDRSFVLSLLLHDRPAIVESILALARTLHTSVVAEGIETEVQARELERLGCTHAQGYLFSRPICTASVEQILMAGRPLGPKRAIGSRAAAC